VNNEKEQIHDLYTNGWVKINNNISFEKEYEKVMETSLEFSYQPETSIHNEGEQFLYLRRRRD
jgi:hypothetical protein